MLTPELLAIAQALGLAQGETIDTTWFSDPLTRLRGILSQPNQRAALFDLLDQIAPPAAVAGTSATAKWHPILGDRANGNLYLTVDTSGSTTLVGVGASYSGTAASLLVDLPLCGLNGSTVTVVAGSDAAPFTASLAVPLGWTRPAHSIALNAILVSVTLTSAIVTLQGLDVDGSGAADAIFDPANLGAESTRLLLGFLREQLHALPGPIAHLVPLLGLDGVTPAFPFATIATDSRALATWLRALTTGSPAPIGGWLAHLAGLLGVASPTVTTGSGGASSWSVPLFAPNATSSVALTITMATAADTVTPLLELGLDVGLVPTGAAPVRVDIAATLVAIPLAGTAGPSAFTNAGISVSAPADQSQSLIPAGPGVTFSVDSVHAGLAWNGTSLAPLIELHNVAIAGIGAFPLVDLHNALTVAGQAASDAVAAAIKAALAGSETGQHLAALAGLVEPASDSSAPLADLTQLLTHPTQTIAGLHRAALVSTTHSWKAYFDEIVGLIGLAGPSSGTGTATDPWSATIVQASPAALQLVAWNAQTSGQPADPQQLRVGLRLAATVAPFTAALALDLLSADLAANGTTTFSVIGACDASVTFAPPAMQPIDGIALGATAVTASARAAFGQPASVSASITGLSVTTPTGTIAIPTITYPFAGGFDITNPTAALGIGVAVLEQLVQALLVQALRARLGPTGVGLAAALGCAGIDGLASDSPAASGLFTDPLGALRAWISKLAVGLSTDGSDFITPIVTWLGALVSTALDGPFPTPAPSLLAGSGTYDDPWQLPLGAGDSPAAAIVWLDPDGPPGVPANIVSDMEAIDNFWTLAVAIADASLYVPSIPDGVDVDGFGTGLQMLSDFLGATDGVVPVASQIPTGGTWTTGTPIAAAHSAQSADPSACTQILTAIDGWAAYGTTRAVLLLGPAFSDHTTWNTLLAQAESAHPGTTNAAATFNLRVSGVEPAQIDLRPVTAVADFYSADLQDDGTNDIAGLSAQIGLVVAQILALKPGAAVLLVAHSTAGIAARAYAAANAAQVRGLVTLGTPHAGAPIEPLTDPTFGDPLRVFTHLLPTGVAAGPLADALTHLQAALDGYLPGTAGALPTPWPYPIADFTGDGSTDTGGVPALALGGPLGGPDGVDLLGTFTTALGVAINAVTRQTPTHLGYGLRVAVPLGADGAVSVGADVRLDLGRLPLAANVTDPPRPAEALTTEISLVRPGGWLSGGPLSYGGSGQPVSDVRVRSAQLGVSFSHATSAGPLVATPVARLHEVAHHGLTSDLVTWGQPLLEAGLGAVFQSITTPAPDPTSSLGALLGALQALGLVTTDASGTTGISADAITALTADPLGLLAPRLSTALAASGIPGFLGVDHSSYQLTLSSLPMALVVTLDPPSIALHTTAASGGLSITDGVTLGFSATLPLTTMTPAITGSLALGPATLTLGAGSLSLALPPAIPALSLYPPPTVAAAKSAFTTAVPRLIIDTVASALLQSALGPDFAVSDVLSLFEQPGQWFIGPNALGDGTALDPAKLTALFQSFGTLPGGVTLTATGANPTTIALATTQPLGGIVSLTAGLSVDHSRHCTPSGTVTVQAPASGPGLTLGVGAGGFSLSVTTGGASPTLIHLLPTFDGAAALAGAAKKLLPSALDALLAAVAPPPAIVGLALDVANALGLYDTAGGFSAHAAQLAAMIDGSWFASIATTTRTQFLTAATAYFNDPSSPLAGALPGSFATVGSTIVWTYPLPAAVATGTLSLAAGWDGSGPTVMLTADSVALTGAPLVTSLRLGLSTGTLSANISAGLDLSSSLGVPAVPQLVATLGGSGISIVFVPLGAGTETILAIPLAPPGPIVTSSSAAMQVLTGWVIPLAADTLLGAVGNALANPMWSGGPSAAGLLTTAGLITGTAPSYRLVTPVVLSTLAGNVLRGLGTISIQLASNPSLVLSFVSAGGQLGLRLLGSLPLDPDGSPVVSVLFGQPATWLGANAGVTLYLFSTSGGGLSFAPALDVRGLGVGVANADSSPILDVDGFRIGSADGYLTFTIALTPALSVSDVGGGIEIDQLGLPVASLDQGSSSNPVAASLLSSGSTSTSGDSQAANPSVNVIAYYLDGAFAVTLAGQTQPVVIPVHASFGPLYIDQLEVALVGTTAVDIGVDGSLAIDGLSVAVDELALQIPFDSILTPAHWSLDLQGLSASFTADAIGIAGGLRKNPGPPIEYDGTLSVTMPGIGFGILAGYGRPSDALGAYTSLFMFVAYEQALGGPPFAFVTGLGGGFGYNRQLQIPTDYNQIPSFPLIEAIDGGIGGGDPLTAFAQMATAIPPRRGSFWVAAGVRFTSFALVNTTAIVAVAIDSGFVIDVLGVSRMALPTESTALASVELALKARYDNQAETLQVQAQLTDNSYLFSHDCQLTGGFALFIWFSQFQFVLTLGGYNPVFTVPANFPVVPRLGFNWSVDSDVVIKGDSYFALTLSCVMAGGALSVTGNFGAVSAWFDASVDMLISWDPFAYEFDVSVDIGASATFQVCFIECATVNVSISIGASLAIAGPPFHGSATIDVYVTSVTISFGSPPQSQNYITDWGTFAGKYLTAGDAHGTAVSMQIGDGLLVSATTNTQAEAGSQAAPWPMGVEFTLITTTRMPANATMVPVSGLNALDIAPMDALAITSTHSLVIEQLLPGGTVASFNITGAPNNWTITPRLSGFPEATWHWTDPKHIPAGARTVSAIAGLSVDAQASCNDPSALLPVASWVVDLPQDALPLPFATTAAVAPVLTGYGADADAIAALVASATPSQALAASVTVLTGNGVFAAGRTAVGLSAGLVPLAAAALTNARSAPPLITPLATGLTMKPVGLPAATVPATITPTAPVMLAGPRLNAVLGSPMQSVVDAPTSVHTTVQSNAPRMRPPVAAVLPGARLLVVQAAQAPRSTAAAIRPRALRNADTGAAIGQPHQNALVAAGADLASGGVTLGAGTMHLWDMATPGGRLTLRGAVAARVICMDRRGTVLGDVELSTTPTGTTVGVAPGTEMMGVACLGPMPTDAKPVSPGGGAVTTRYAPAGAHATVGWQSTSTVAQVGPSSFAARGATVRVIRAASTIRNAQRASIGVALAADVLSDQVGIETRLPTGLGVVIIVLDAVDSISPLQDDLAIGAVGARLGAPVRILVGARRVVIYDVVAPDPKATSLTVATASASAWCVSAVVGALGTSAEWAATLAAGIPDGFVSDGPLAPTGALTVTYAVGAAA